METFWRVTVTNQRNNHTKTSYYLNNHLQESTVYLALQKSIETTPMGELPRNPECWLITVSGQPVEMGK